jgi:N-formylglutamate deformylase
MEPIWQLIEGPGPLVATAIHDGHTVRPDVAAALALSPEERLREEDPYTAHWTTVAATRIVGLHSRFEVDLNRPREKAVYRVPADAWGLQVWQTTVPDAVLERSLAQYDAFYAEVERVLRAIVQQHGRFVVFDLHTYNHRREGPDGPVADAALNPEVNVGTGIMDRVYWGPLVERFMADLRAVDYQGCHLDVRENIKFRGGHFANWIHTTFPQIGCALSIEFKKFFMDEWTGAVDREQLDALGAALAATVPGVLAELQRL